MQIFEESYTTWTYRPGWDWSRWK